MERSSPLIRCLRRRRRHSGLASLVFLRQRRLVACVVAGRRGTQGRRAARAAAGTAIDRPDRGAAPAASAASLQRLVAYIDEHIGAATTRETKALRRQLVQAGFFDHARRRRLFRRPPRGAVVLGLGAVLLVPLLHRRRTPRSDRMWCGSGWHRRLFRAELLSERRIARRATSTAWAFRISWT